MLVAQHGKITLGSSNWNLSVVEGMLENVVEIVNEGEGERGKLTCIVELFIVYGKYIFLPVSLSWFMLRNTKT